jgi:hypothetical protein
LSMEGFVVLPSYWGEKSVKGINIISTSLITLFRELHKIYVFNLSVTEMIERFLNDLNSVDIT